ncbi:MAG: VWA domain-containing protein [Acidobacteria bacterium]|nr:VWA domain-containing protein [Acidobacteriota bacterium]
MGFAGKIGTASRRITICVFLCMAAIGAQKETVPGGPGQAIKVRVDVVLLPVVVTDINGNHARDLKKEDFQVFEDGVPQEIASFAAVEEPISVALTLDTSGSTEFQLGRIRQEAMRFIRLLREDDSIAIITFADEVTLLEPFNIYHKKNPDVLRKLKSGGLSAVYEAVWLSINQVLNLEYGRKALVFFSDGVDTRSETVTEEETLELARKTDATIYCIYFNTNKDRGKRMPSIIDPAFEASLPALQAQWPPVKIPTGRKNPEYAAGLEYMTKLAQYSGGILIDASRIENLGAAFARIAQELRSQYSIGYYAKNQAQDGKFRKVEVRVNRPGLTVRTKQGYYFMK